MKRDKRIFLLLELILFLPALFFLYLNIRGEKAPKRVAVFVLDSEAGGWASFWTGAEQGARDAGIDLTVLHSGGLTGEEAGDLLRGAIESGIDGLVLQALPGGEGDGGISDRKRDLPILFVANGPEEEKETGAFARETRRAKVGPDYETAGFLLLSGLAEDYEGNLRNRRIGLIGRDRREEHTAGDVLVRGLGQKGGRVSWQLWETLGTEQERREEISLLPPVDLVLCLNTEDLELAGSLAEEKMLHGAMVYGIGNSSKAVYYLDHGIVRLLLAADGFAMGYRAVEELGKKLENPFYRMEDTLVELHVLRREDLFQEYYIPGI